MAAGQWGWVMTPEDKPKFVAVLEGLAALKPGARLTPESFELFWRAMAPGWSLEDFKAAAAHLVRTEEFMPNPYHFEQLRRAGFPTAGEEWTKVLAVARGHAAEPLTPVGERALAAIGGLEVVRMSERTKTPFLARSFAEHYSELLDVSDVRDSVPQLARQAVLRVVGPSATKLASQLRGDVVREKR